MGNYLGREGRVVSRRARAPTRWRTEERGKDALATGTGTVFARLAPKLTESCNHGCRVLPLSHIHSVAVPLISPLPAFSLPGFPPELIGNILYSSPTQHFRAERLNTAVTGHVQRSEVSSVLLGLTSAPSLSGWTSGATPTEVMSRTEEPLCCCRCYWVGSVRLAPGVRLHPAVFLSTTNACSLSY